MRSRQSLSTLPTRFTSVWDLDCWNRFTRPRSRTNLQRGLQLRRQQAMPVFYESVQMDVGFRADLIVEGKVIVEIKSIEAIAPVHRKQLLTYLRLTDKRLG